MVSSSFSLSPQNAFGFMLSTLLALLATLLLSRADIVTLFILLGQGHFFITYLYQARARKIDWKYLIAYAGSLFLLLYIAERINQPESLFLFMAGTLFAAHFFIDEYHIQKETLTKARFGLGIAFVALYGALALKEGYGVTLGYLPVVLSIILAAPLIRERFATRTLSSSEMMLIVASIVLCYMSLTATRISVEAMLGFIILFHYIRWYTHYLYVFWNTPKLVGYVRDICVIQGIVLFLFILYSILPYGAWHLGYLFEKTYFFMWTILHIVFSAQIKKYTWG